MLKRFIMKRRNFVCVLITLFISIASPAQDVIDEDFIDILSKNAQEILNEQDADFSVNTIPEKWINESAVTIGYKKHILFDKRRSGLLGGKENLVLLEKKRMKIKLADKKAVDNFSQLYFRYSSKFDGFSAFIYKEDGTKKEIPLTKAVSIEDNDRVPEFFKSFFDQNVSNRNEYYKVPVADLLPGDILEFVSQTSSTLNVRRTPYYQFDPQYELCQKPMPVMVHKIIIETDNNSFITARSINGAPEFQQSTNGDFNVYTWTDRNRERLKDVSFINEYMVLPLVKFQITYTDGREIKSLFAGTKGQIKNNFDATEIGKKAFANYSNVGSSYVYGSMVTVDALSSSLWVKMKANGAKDVPEDEFIKMAYYYIRHTQVFNNYYYSDKQFCYLLGQLLYTRKIPSEIIVTTPNNLTTPADMLFESELTWCLRVKGKYIFKTTEHSNLYDIDEDMINNEAYKLPINSKEQTEVVKISDTKMDDNKSLYQLYVSVDSSQKWLNVERTSAYSGIQKEKNSYTALRFTPYMFSDTRTYNGPDDFENVPDKYSSQIYQQKKAITDEFKERKPVYMKEQAEKDLEASVRYTNFEIKDEGRSFKKPELMFKETFQVGEKIRRAGKKLLINLPGLMGGQLQVKKEERTRSFDIDVRYPRKLRWQINLTIPDGYTAEGLEGLTTNIDNETGSFTSTATLNGNVVTLDIQKIYKQKNISKEKWPLMLEFVDAAYNFSHRLILLKPVK
jgi:hypothetical protein